jgi:hypothetical protein
MINYKAQIDIDGNANAWSGLYWKLRSNSVVLKVASPKQHVQWYYDRLIPWEHFVPIKNDLSDLEEIVSFVLDPANERKVREIANKATELAESLAYRTEVQRTHADIAAFFSRGRG